MSDIRVSFQLQTLEGTNVNVVTVSRSQVFVASSYTSSAFGQFPIAANAVDTAVPFTTSANKVISIENGGAADLTVKFNSPSGTAFLIPKTTGFIALTTTTPILQLYVSNADTANQGILKIFIGG